jgi:PAS domain S-box-containing protein
MIMTKPSRKAASKNFIQTSTEAILESISDGVFTVDMEWRVTSFNRAAEMITGIPRAEAIGRLCSEVFKSSMCESQCALRRTLKTGQPVLQQSGFIINAHGQRIPVSISAAVLRDSEGRMIGGAETFRDLTELEALRKQLGGQHYRFGEMVSRSPSMQSVFDLAKAVAGSPSTVLIRGETGTGKELLAQSIHEMSGRSDHPFVAINCGALPDTLLESELFGYKRGAFTGANKDKPGRIAMAGEGTLFLDEIGEISPALQVRLLRVLQQRVFEPLGGTKPEKLKARVLAATNRDLDLMVRDGVFRQDLFYRVNVISLCIPPLRERLEDIPVLTHQLIDRFNRLQERRIQGTTPEALALLMAHDWPGNIRELENVIERAFILCNSERIGSEHLPSELRGSGRFPDGERMIATAREAAESETIRAALERNGNNRLATARELGIHKATLYRKMKALGISAPRGKK